MAVIFLLGPGTWDASKGSAAAPSPMHVRRQIAKTLEAGGHEVILMEDDPDRDGEDMIQKFDRLLRRAVTDVVVYWPVAFRSVVCHWAHRCILASLPASIGTVPDTA